MNARHEMDVVMVLLGLNIAYIGGGGRNWWMLNERFFYGYMLIRINVANGRDFILVSDFLLHVPSNNANTDVKVNYTSWLGL